MKITMAHGSGGESTSKLIADVFAKHFNNEYLSKLEDSAVVPGNSKIAMTTDSFVVTPIEFPGGDIGRLSVCGTVNDLLMSGAKPMYITCGCVLEEGLDLEVLDRIIASMAKTAKEAGVIVVTGDTKVIEKRSQNPGLIINTSGVGFIDDSVPVPGPFNLEDRDKIIVSGNLGDHHATILGSRMGIENSIVSDNAPLVDIVKNLMDKKIRIHAMRDVTRGGLGTVLNEFSSASKCTIELDEEALPVSAAVKDFCGLLGLDPLYMGNEGKMVLSVHESDAENALSI
ncbi:MAG: hydrogenase expression/formation protein HypE, partial [Butyrivibrio sp.]|nr:hydrogenase expression/formation protein HypE [Butyrivibrio sp.]